MSNTPRHNRITGRFLNDIWHVGARHALYREDGKWYHTLSEFPGALFDAHGYLLFQTESEYRSCTYLLIGEHLHIPQGISAIPGYIRMSYDIFSKNKVGEEKTTYIFHDRRGEVPPEEIVSPKELCEGAVRKILINAYERNAVARAECIKYYGYMCRCVVSTLKLFTVTLAKSLSMYIIGNHYQISETTIE